MSEHQLSLNEEGQDLYEYIRDCLDEGNGATEKYLVRFLTRCVATEEELVQLAHHRLSVWQLLNSEYAAFDPTPYFRAWNERSGLSIFPGV